MILALIIAAATSGPDLIPGKVIVALFSAIFAAGGGIKLGDVLAVIDVTTLRKMPFADQLEALLAKCESRGARSLPGDTSVGPARRAGRVRGVRIDATSIGAMMAEEATKKLGGICQGVVFNVATKGEMYGLMRRRFEERSIRIPVSRELREDLHAVQRVVSTGGNVTYSAPRNADGHSDRAAALALVCEAAKSGPYIKPFTVGSTRPYDRRRI